MTDRPDDLRRDDLTADALPEPEHGEPRLVDRLVTGDAGLDDWNAWRAIAADDPDAWRRLAEAQRDANALGELVEGAEAVAARVALPWDTAGRRPAVNDGGTTTAAGFGFALAGTPSEEDARRSRSRLREALGWLAAAAAIAFAVASGRGGVVTGGTPNARPNDDGASVQPVAYADAGEALASYLELGRDEGTVVRELPQRVLIDSRPAQEGEGYEVLYLRQILERQVVPELYRPVGVDEFGNATLEPFDPRPADAL